MYRFRLIAQVKYGRFKEYSELSNKLNALCRERWLTEFTVLIPVVGVSNEVIYSEADYPDLATFQKAGEAFQTDAEAMNLSRSFAD